MPSAVAPTQTATSPHRNDQPNYDQEVNDFMRDLEFNNDTTATTVAPQEPAKDIDEEVQVKRKRKPNPKLDEARLLSQSGVPKLRRLTKSKLRFRGKGHEYADMTTLLNTYQLWLDDLYPKAKFKDGLAMVEKVGHTKRIQITRKAWLDATKPHGRQDSPERLGDAQMSGGLGREQAQAGGEQALDDEAGDIFGGLDAGVGGGPRIEAAGADDAPEDDELDALLNANAEAGGRQSAVAGKQGPARGPFEEDSDVEEDELDALLNEQTGGATDRQPLPNGSSGKHAGAGNDDFADDEEAMASMGW